MNIHDYFSGRKFRGFAVLRFIPRNQNHSSAKVYFREIKQIR